MLEKYVQGFVIPRSIEEADENPDDPRVLDGFVVIESDVARIVGIDNVRHTACVLDSKDLVALVEAVIRNMTSMSLEDLYAIVVCELQKREVGR
jgi:hypothetical protein